MAYKNKSIFSFDKLSDTGLDKVPQGSIVQCIEDNTGMFTLDDKTGITENSTFTQVVDLGIMGSVGSGETVNIPTISGVTEGFENTDIIITITNYYSEFTYNVAVGCGTFTRVDDTITWSLAEVGSSTVYDISVIAVSGNSMSETAIKSVNVIDIPIIDDQALLYNSVSMGEFTELKNTEVQSEVLAIDIDTTNIIDPDNTSTISEIYIDNKLVNLSAGDNISTDKGPFTVQTVNNDGNLEVREVPEDADAVILGDLNSFIIGENGSLWGCGDNYYGQLMLGDSGTDTKRSVFTDTGITDIKDFTSNNYYNLLVNNAGELFSIGSNGSGQLGLGNTTNKYELTDTGITNVKSVYNSELSSYILKNDGTL